MTSWQFDFLMFTIMTGFGWTFIPSHTARQIVGWGFVVSGIWWLILGVARGLS